MRRVECLGIKGEEVGGVCGGVGSGHTGCGGFGDVLAVGNFEQSVELREKGESVVSLLCGHGYGGGGLWKVSSLLRVAGQAA